MNIDFRCDCPITSALDLVGDKWSLVIVKQMLFKHKKTFKDFIESDESIASNILSMRLKTLEKIGIIYKKNHPGNKKVNLYFLTEKGIGLTPLIMELGLWSDRFVRDEHPGLYFGEDTKALKNDKIGFTDTLINNYKNIIQ